MCCKKQDLALLLISLGVGLILSLIFSSVVVKIIIGGIVITFGVMLRKHF